MKLYTKYHGVIDYEEEDIITFPKGLPGFRELKKFILFNIEENKMFSMLHSIENLEIGLAVVSPFYVMKDYEFKLDEDKLSRLKIETETDVLILNTVCFNKDVKNLTTNLKAPLIINTREKLGEQIILDNEKYLVKHPLIKEE